MSQPTPTRRPLSRPFSRIAASVVGTVLAAGVAVTIAPATAAFADTSSLEAQFVADMNAARQAAGLRPYSVASDLTSVARSWSAHMAGADTLSHNPNLSTQVQNWQAVGENVGEGPTVSDIHTAFMNSPGHRANILDHDFSQVGVGVSVDANGVIWVTEDFRQPMQSTAPAPAPAPAPATTTTRTTTTRTTTTAPRPAPVPAAVAASAPYTSSLPSVAAAPAQARAHHPAASASAVARQRLLDRLHRIRSTHRIAVDPVAAALQYERTLSALTH